MLRLHCWQKLTFQFFACYFFKAKMNEVVLTHEQSKQLAASTTFLCTVERWAALINKRRGWISIWVHGRSGASLRWSELALELNVVRQWHGARSLSQHDWTLNKKCVLASSANFLWIKKIQGRVTHLEFYYTVPRCAMSNEFSARIEPVSNSAWDARGCFLCVSFGECFAYFYQSPHSYTLDISWQLLMWRLAVFG